MTIQYYKCGMLHVQIQKFSRGKGLPTIKGGFSLRRPGRGGGRQILPLQNPITWKIKQGSGPLGPRVDLRMCRVP